MILRGNQLWTDPWEQEKKQAAASPRPPKGLNTVLVLLLILVS